MSLTEIKFESEIALSFPTVLYRVRSNFEECIRDNTSIGQTLEKITYNSSQVKGIIFYFPIQGSERSECLGAGILIVRYKDGWSYPICIDVCHSGQFVSNLERQLKDKLMHLIIFKDQNIIDVFFQKEEMNFANEIIIDNYESNQFFIFSLLRNRIELIDRFADFNGMVIKNAKKLNEEYYGSRFAFSIILSGKLEKSSMEDYDTVLKIINEKFMPTQLSIPVNQPIQNQSGIKQSIGEKLSDFKQSAGMQLNIAKEQLGSAIYNVKNKAEELVSNVQSKIGNDSNSTSTETLAVNPIKYDIQDNRVEKVSEKTAMYETGKTIKEAITNLKDKASEKAQDLKSNIENRFTKSNADYKPYDNSIQNQEKSSEKMEQFSSQIEYGSYDATKNMYGSESNAPLHKDFENKKEADYVDSNLRSDMREQQPLLMQEQDNLRSDMREQQPLLMQGQNNLRSDMREQQPLLMQEQDEKKSLGSKLSDLKESATHQLTAAKEQIGSTISSVKIKAEGLVTDLQNKVYSSHDITQNQNETEIELPSQESKDFAQNSSENKIIAEESSAYSGAGKLKETFENIKEKATEKVQDFKSKINNTASTTSENSDQNDYIDHNLRQTMRESQPLLQQEPPQEETTSIGKENLKETIENIKEKVSEKAQEFKAKIEDKLSNENAIDEKDQDISLQTKLQNNQLSSSRKEFDTTLQSTSSDILIGTSKTNDENDYIDHDLRQKMRESQPLVQQERPEQETTSIGSKLNDIKQSAQSQFQSIKNQIVSGIENITEKTYEKAHEIQSSMQNSEGEKQNIKKDTVMSSAMSSTMPAQSSMQNLESEKQNIKKDTVMSSAMLSTMPENEVNIDTTDQNEKNKVTTIEVEVKKYKITNLDKYKNKDSLNEATEPSNVINF